MKRPRRVVASSSGEADWLVLGRVEIEGQCHHSSIAVLTRNMQ